MDRIKCVHSACIGLVVLLLPLLILLVKKQLPTVDYYQYYCPRCRAAIATTTTTAATATTSAANAAPSRALISSLTRSRAAFPSCFALHLSFNIFKLYVRDRGM